MRINNTLYRVNKLIRPQVFRSVIIIFICSLSLTGIIAFITSDAHDEHNSKASIWKKIKPFFAPPAVFKDKYDSFPSPLKFYDGRAVKDKKDWGLRRKEILDRWNAMMGEWPPLLKNRKFIMLDTLHRDNFTQHKIRFNWTPNESTEGYLLIPDSKGIKPAVVTVYYEPETSIGHGQSPYRDFAYQLARRGFVTLSIGTAETTKAETYSIYYPGIQQAQVQPLSMLAYASANAWQLLADMPEVDSSSIGIIGHSYGGKWAMFGSCLYDKFACAVWSDPGIVFDGSENANYWEPWYLGYYPPPWRKRGMITPENPAKGLYPELIAAHHDLTELHALMAPRPFLVSGGSVDIPQRWTALNHSIAVNRLLGYENRVAMSNRPDHSPNKESNEIVYLFLEYFLKYK